MDIVLQVNCNESMCIVSVLVLIKIFPFIINHLSASKFTLCMYVLVWPCIIKKMFSWFIPYNVASINTEIVHIFCRSENSLQLFGALRRLKDWHNAVINFVLSDGCDRSDEAKAVERLLTSSCQMEHLSPGEATAVVWRGKLSIIDKTVHYSS